MKQSKSNQFFDRDYYQIELNRNMSQKTQTKSQPIVNSQKVPIFHPRNSTTPLGSKKNKNRKTAYDYHLEKVKELQEYEAPSLIEEYGIRSIL